jgi:hypothetical protein
VSEVTTIGLDIAKAVFHAHGACASGKQVFSRRLSRGKLLEFMRQQPRSQSSSSRQSVAAKLSDKPPLEESGRSPNHATRVETGALTTAAPAATRSD